MLIDKVTLETGSRYPNKGRSYGSSIDTLTITIPLPGGRTVYELDLPVHMKDSLEHAVGLTAAKALEDTPF